MAASGNAVAKRSSNDALMLPPPPPPKRIKRPSQVLDEDVYAAGLSHIIARDFFPELLETQAQNEYLSAVQSKDKGWIQEAGRRMQEVMTPRPDRGRFTRSTSLASRTPLASDVTPRRTDRASFAATPMSSGGDDEVESQPEIDLNMSLGAYQARYTSEDNESFNELLDKQNTRRQTKYAHFFHGNKLPSDRQIAYRKEQALIADSTPNENRSLIVTNSSGEERRLLSANRPSQDLNERKASVRSFVDRQGPRNTFMFDPDSVQDRLSTAADEAENRSKAPPRAVTFSATRFSEGDERSNLIPPSPSMSAIDAAIAGRPRHCESSAGYGGAETPRVNGYAFVDAEPTPAELCTPVLDGEAEEAERKEFDKLLPKVDTGGNPFNIAEQSKREDIHHRLVEKADITHRKRDRVDEMKRLGITPSKTPTPRFTTAPKKIAGQMTPAARQLAARIATPQRKAW